MVRRWMSAIIAVIASALVMTGCQNCDSEPLDRSRAQILRIAAEDFPDSLDPRGARDLPSSTVLQMLFEGLMRPGRDGSADLGVAEAVSISDDALTYTFTLRDSVWSNGDPVTAYDFEYSWKTVLEPTFPAPNAAQFYVIEGAKAAKAGALPIDSVGITALDATLKSRAPDLSRAFFTG